MNVGHIVKLEVTATGARIRVWIDDEKGRHLTVAEVPITPVQLATLVVGIEKEQEKSAQYQFAFDD